MEDYFLVDTGSQMPRWCTLAPREAGGMIWVDPQGRKFPSEDGWALAHVRGEGHDAPLSAEAAIAGIERRFAMVHLLDPWSGQGWLSPEGRFYGCRFGRHEDLMHALLRKRVGAAEEQGFVRVHDDSIRTGGIRPRDALFTPRQAEVLALLGYGHLTPGMRREARYEPDRKLPPPRFAYRPPAGVALPPEVRTRPVRERKAAAGPAAWERVLARLRGDDALGSALAGDVEHDADFGGRWTWMMRFGGFDVGAEEAPSALLRSPGLRLDATAFDQVEILPDPVPGIHVDAEARAVFAAGLRAAPAGP